MKTLAQYVEGLKTGLPAPGFREGTTALVVSGELQRADVPAAKADKFAADVVALAASDGFVKELSDRIREPGLTETKEQFIARCMAEATELLKMKLEGK